MLKTLLIVSRHPSHLFLEQAKALRGRFRVVVAITDPEVEIFRGVEGIEVINWSELGERRLREQTLSRQELVADAERQSGIRLYVAASNYLVYYRLISNFEEQVATRFWKNEDEVMNSYLVGWLAFSEIMQTANPDYVFIQTPDHIFARLVQALAYQRGIFTLSPYFGPLFGESHVFLYTGIIATNFLMEHLIRHPDRIPAAAWERGRAALKRLQQAGPLLPAYLRDLRDKSESKERSSFYYLSKLIRSPMALKNVSIKEVFKLRSYMRKRSWLNANMTRQMPTGRYVLFLMSHQPEASTTMQAQRWIDQERVIEQIAINAPSGVKIVVKEHPRTFGRRASRYFGELTSLPNVVLVHPTMDSRALLTGAEFIFTLTGSNGFESWLLGKKVITLGRPYYSGLPGIKTIDHPSDFWETALDPDWSVNDLDDMRERAAAAYAASVHPLGTPSSDGVWPVPEEGGKLLADATEYYTSFIEAEKLRLSDFNVGTDTRPESSR
jgi:hypothetical protein